MSSRNGGRYDNFRRVAKAFAEMLKLHDPRFQAELTMLRALLTQKEDDELRTILRRTDTKYWITRAQQQAKRYEEF